MMIRVGDWGEGVRISRTQRSGGEMMTKAEAPMRPPFLDLTRKKGASFCFHD